MKDGVPYTYVILRYRHDPLAGETVNVGVVVHSGTFLGCKVRRTMGRLKKVFPDIDRSALLGHLRAVERGIARLRTGDAAGLLSDLGDAASYANRAMPSEDSSLVWSSMGSGVASRAEMALDRLFARFVSKYDEESRSARTDDEVWQPVRERLVERRILDRLRPKRIESPLDTVDFDYAWKNGAWHCYQPLSFDLTTSDGIRDKAARWSGHMTGLNASAEMIRPYFIVGAPTEASLIEDYRRAVDLLKASSLAPQVYEESQVDELVDRLVAEIDTHEAT